MERFKIDGEKSRRKKGPGRKVRRERKEAKARAHGEDSKHKGKEGVVDINVVKQARKDIDRLVKEGIIDGTEEGTEEKTSSGKDGGQDVVSKSGAAPVIPRIKKAHGRPPFEPTEALRALVYGRSAGGIGLMHIAKEIGIHHTTLLKYFREELDEAMLVRNINVQQTAYEMARAGKSPGMTIFWLKTQCHWKEPKQEVEATMKHEHSFVDDFSKRITGLALRMQQEKDSDIGESIH